MAAVTENELYEPADSEVELVRHRVVDIEILPIQNVDGIIYSTPEVIQKS